MNTKVISESLTFRPDQLRVTITVPSLHPEMGGPSFSVPSLCESLCERGLQVELVSEDSGPAFTKPHIPPVVGLNLTLHRKPHFTGILKGENGFRLMVKERSQSAKSSIIHDNGIWTYSNWSAAKVAFALELPLVISPRGMLEPWSLKQKILKKRIAWWSYQRSIMRRAKVLHATSEMEAINLRKLGLNQPIAIIPNGVAIPSQSSISEFGSPKRTVLFISRIHPKKGLLNLIQAWSQINPSNWRLVIAGPNEGGHLADVRRAHQELCPQADISYPGPLAGEQKWAAYRAADLFVLPSFSENFGLVIAEAMGCGLPVITTKGTPWDVLQAEHCGWWIDVGSDALIKALSEAFSYPDDKLKEMGRKGTHIVRNRFSWSVIAREMQAVYAWVLNGGNSPSCLQF